MIILQFLSYRIARCSMGDVTVERVSKAVAVFVTVFVNILLERCHAHLFAYCLGLLLQLVQ